MDDLLILEKELQFKHFTHEKALQFGMTILNIVKQKKLKPVRIRVTYCHDIIFQYLMDGKKGDMWLNRKENTVMKAKHSSLYVYNHQDNYKDMINDEQYAICGGGFPLIENNEIKGVFIVSGLDHEEDHQLIIKALKEMEDK